MIHINCKENDVSELVLLPGDPLRAKFISENFLDNSYCYNTTRNMLGFTGFYKGKKVSIQSTGMGIPSISIYLNELIMLGGKKFIRIGTCGAIQKQIDIMDIIIPMSASTNSNVNKLIFNNCDYASCASFDLLYKAYNIAKEKQITTHVGNILTSDTFYDDENNYEIWKKYNILALEMETSALYTLAAKFKVDALSILTVTDDLLTKISISSAEREKTLRKMIELSLETIIK